jgi:hypothetical protein
MPKRHKKLFFAIGNSPVLQKQFPSEGVGNFAEGQGKKTGTKIGQFASPDSLIDLYPIYNDFAKGLQADFTAPYWVKRTHGMGVFLRFHRIAAIYSPMMNVVAGSCSKYQSTV